MNIPNFLDVPLAQQDGTLTPIWRDLLSSLMQQLQSNLSEEGFKIPMQTSDNIAKLNNSKSIGTLIYNSDTNKLLINLNGSFKEITTS